MISGKSKRNRDQASPTGSTPYNEYKKSAVETPSNSERIFKYLSKRFPSVSEAELHYRIDLEGFDVDDSSKLPLLLQSRAELDLSVRSRDREPV